MDTNEITNERPCRFFLFNLINKKKFFLSEEPVALPLSFRFFYVFFFAQ